MSDEIEFKKENNLPKSFKIDFEKIKTLSDISIILKSMDLTISWSSEECPNIFKEIYEKGFLKQEKLNK